MHENDRTGVDLLLGQRLLRELGCANWSEVKARAQAGSDEVFPRLFSVVAAAADSYESSVGPLAKSSAEGILRAAAFDLAMLAENLAERLQLRDGPFTLAKTGGMIGRSNYLETQLDERLCNVFPAAKIGLLRVSPAEAAARLALHLLAAGDTKHGNTIDGHPPGR
jgi:hypothetical protein